MVVDGSSEYYVKIDTLIGMIAIKSLFVCNEMLKSVSLVSLYIMRKIISRKE